MGAAAPAAMSRASFFACFLRDSRDGRAGRDLDVVIATSFHESPVPAEHQAERRCNRTNLRPNRWEYSLAAGWWRPAGALPAVSAAAGSKSTAAPPARKPRAGQRRTTLSARE